MLRKIVPKFSSFYLHKVKYLEALKLQELLVQYHSEELSKATLLLLQHYPVYTTGIRSFVYDKIEEDFLKKLGADFVRTNRGGLITFHGPGQLVAYPIINLKSLGLGIRKYVFQLEEVIIQLCSDLNLPVSRSPHTGVWMENNKVCAMGINVTKGTSSHGLALNCDIDLSWFGHIVPCGIHGKGVISLSECLNRSITVDDIIPRFVEHFTSIFEVNSMNVHSFDERLTVQDLFTAITGF